MKDKILGVLYGMAIGDAMGMPPELWSRKKVLAKYKKITDFMEGDPENEISYQYHRGNFTDDTSQAITILDSLIETDFVPDTSNIAKHILAWAKKENAFENNILGPTSKITLELFEKGEDAGKYSDAALSNGGNENTADRNAVSAFQEIGGEFTLVDATSTVLSVIATILMLARYTEQWIMWVIVNVVSVVLWVMALMSGGEGAVTLLVMWIAYLFNSIYGYVNWRKMASKNS